MEFRFYFKKSLRFLKARRRKDTLTMSMFGDDDFKPRNTSPMAMPKQSSPDDSHFGGMFGHVPSHSQSSNRPGATSAKQSNTEATSAMLAKIAQQKASEKKRSQMGEGRVNILDMIPPSGETKRKRSQKPKSFVDRWEDLIETKPKPKAPEDNPNSPKYKHTKQLWPPARYTGDIDDMHEMIRAGKFSGQSKDGHTKYEITPIEGYDGHYRYNVHDNAQVNARGDRKMVHRAGYLLHAPHGTQAHGDVERMISKDRKAAAAAKRKRTMERKKKEAARQIQKSTFVRRLYLRELARLETSKLLKAVNTKLPSEHPLSMTMVNNNSRMKMKNETHAGNPSLPRSNFSRQPKEQNSANKLLSVAAQVKPHYDALLRGIGEEHGFYHTSNWNPDEEGRIKTEVDQGHKRGGMVIYAPLKKKEKIDKNAHEKFMHDKDSKKFNPKTDVHGSPGYNRITDIVRGSIGVPHRADLPHIMHSLRQRISHPDSKFELAEEPKDNFASPKDTGYSDYNIRLRHKKTGHVTELQLHTLDMLHAKDAKYGNHDRGGHKYYDAQTDPKKNADNLSHDELMGRQRHLYGHEVLSSEISRTPSIEKHPHAIRLANDHIKLTNHTVHSGGELRHPKRNIHTKKL